MDLNKSNKSSATFVLEFLLLSKHHIAVMSLDCKITLIHKIDRYYRTLKFCMEEGIILKAQLKMDSGKITLDPPIFHTGS